MFSKTLNFACLRNAASPSFNFSRNYAFKTDLKVKWVRPPKISCIKPEKSGDLKAYESPDSKRFLVNFEKSEELKTANDLVKSIFTLENNRRNESVYTVMRETAGLVRRHDHDAGSMETKSK